MAERRAARRRGIEQARRLLKRQVIPVAAIHRPGGPLILYYDTPAAGPDSKATLQWYRKLAKLGI